MSEKNVIQLTEERKKQLADAIVTVNQANECSVLMTILCQKMNLQMEGLTHVKVIETFTKLQKDSLDAQKLLQEYYLVTPVPQKVRKQRIKKQ